jgi:alpha-galactosidase
VVRNLRFLEQHRRELPIDTVQIDDGYQADIGDWLITNDKFPRGMSWLASEIKRAGYTPGLWLAPFMLSESSRSFAEHPDFIIRDESGSPALATENWQRRNFGVDGSNPDVRAWLTDLFRTICDDWGYDYVKIDFLFAAAIAGRRYDPAATRISAYRQALQAVRDGVGDHRFILGCGSLMAPSVGAFDGNRIGLDVAPFWRFLTTEERQTPKPRFRRPDDGLSAEGAIRNTLTRAWMHGRLWHNDPDCVLVRTDRTKLTLDETRTLATVIALSGGMVLSSDDLPKVPPERLDILSMLLPALPHAARPLDLMLTDMPETLEWSAPDGTLRLVGLFNFDDDAKDLTYNLPEGDWHAYEFWSGRYLGVSHASFTRSLVDAHGCNLIALRAVADRPQLVGTGAHIGCGALDVVAESWDNVAETLSITLAPVGTIERSITVATAGRTFASATATAGEVQVEQGSNWVRCRVSAREEIHVTLVFR